MPSDPGGAGSAEPLPVSPELILVAPPEEARLAREQLAEAAPGDWDEFLANIRAREVAIETAVPAEALPRRQLAEAAPGDWDEFLANIRAREAAIETVAPAAARPRRKHRVRLTVIAAVVIAAAAFGIVRAVRGHDETATAVSRSPAIAEGTQKHRAVAPKPAPARRPKATEGRKPSKPPARAATSKPTKRPTFVPARVFSWPSEPAAKRYLVRFFRNGHKVLEARTVRARLVLPKSFVFRPGSYRWTVVPLGVAGKGPLVDSKFVIS
jgi:hypothetical protein